MIPTLIAMSSLLGRACFINHCIANPVIDPKILPLIAESSNPLSFQPMVWATMGIITQPIKVDIDHPSIVVGIHQIALLNLFLMKNNHCSIPRTVLWKIINIGKPNGLESNAIISPSESVPWAALKSRFTNTPANRPKKRPIGHAKAVTQTQSPAFVNLFRKRNCHWKAPIITPVVKVFDWESGATKHANNPSLRVKPC